MRRSLHRHDVPAALVPHSVSLCGEDLSCSLHHPGPSGMMPFVVFHRSMPLSISSPQVIMDFDLTMTAPGSEQCHHMFET